MALFLLNNIFRCYSDMHCKYIADITIYTSYLSYRAVLRYFTFNVLVLTHSQNVSNTFVLLMVREKPSNHHRKKFG